jgi:hypothetical protein
MAQRASRSFGPLNLIPLTLSKGGELAEKLRGNADVLRALALARKGDEAFPDEPSEWSWAVFRTTDAAAAVHMAELVRKSEFGRLRRQIHERLAPWDVGAALVRYWAAEIAGRPDEARDVLRNLAGQGVPMPFDPSKRGYKIPCRYKNCTYFVIELSRLRH